MMEGAGADSIKKSRRGRRVLDLGKLKKGQAAEAETFDESSMNMFVLCPLGG
jgi:hypothetical protein